MSLIPSVSTNIAQYSPQAQVFESEEQGIEEIVLSLVPRDNLSQCALVNKKWKEIIYSENFQAKIRPKNCCGKEEWEKLGFRVIEPRIPLAYFDHQDEGLMLVPGHDIAGTIMQNLADLVPEGIIEPYQLYKIEANYPSYTHWTAYKTSLYRIPHGMTVLDESLTLGEGIIRTLRENGQGAQVAGLVDTFVIGLLEEIRGRQSPFTIPEDV